VTSAERTRALRSGTGTFPILRKLMATVFNDSLDDLLADRAPSQFRPRIAVSV
jgi:hypothetical protein